MPFKAFNWTKHHNYVPLKPSLTPPKTPNDQTPSPRSTAQDVQHVASTAFAFAAILQNGQATVARVGWGLAVGFQRWLVGFCLEKGLVKWGDGFFAGLEGLGLGPPCCSDLTKFFPSFPQTAAISSQTTQAKHGKARKCIHQTSANQEQNHQVPSRGQSINFQSSSKQVLTKC